MKTIKNLSLKLFLVILLFVFLSGCGSNAAKSEINSKEMKTQESPGVKETGVKEQAKDEPSVTKEDSEQKNPPKPLWIDDFDRCAPSNNRLGGATGSFHHPGQSSGNDLRVTYDEAPNRPGCFLKLTYDITAKKGSVGYRSKLNGADLSMYSKLVLDVMRGYLGTTRFKIELKAEGGGGDFYAITHIERGWKKYEIPLNKFGDKNVLSNLHELVITFAPGNIRPGSEKGVIYIDNIYVE